MKKTLIALAAFAASASYAQSTVTIAGQLDGGFGSTTNTAGISAPNITSGFYGANRLRFVGTEDLGGGNKANFTLDMQLSLLGGTSGNGLFNCGAWLGMSGASWGELRLGRQGTLSAATICSLDLFGCYGGFGAGGVLLGGTANAATAANGAANWFAANPSRGGAGYALSTVGGGFSGLTPAAAGTTQVVAAAISTTPSADPTRVVNAVTYSSPSYSGFSAALQYAFGGTANATTSTTDGATSAVQVNYVAGPIWASLAVQNAAGTAASPATGSTTTLGANYDFGIAKIGFGMQKETGSGPGIAFADGTALAIVVAGNFGAVTPYLRFGNRTESGGVRVGTETVSQVTNLGVTYALSKRTKLYADYSVDTQPLSRVPAATTSPSQFGVGIQHTF